MRISNRVSARPFKVRKLRQLWKLVQESHELPLTGEPRKPELVGPGELGVTFIGHSSFLLQIGGKSVLIDPVFAKRLVVLRRQRRPGVQITDLPAIDVVFPDACAYGPPEPSVAACGRPYDAEAAGRGSSGCGAEWG